MLLPINDLEAISFAFRRAVLRARERYEEDCAAAGRQCDPTVLVGIRLHVVRHHSITSWARTDSLSLFELLKISGYRSSRMLAQYAHMSSEDVATKLATLCTAGQAQGGALLVLPTHQHSHDKRS